MYIELEKGLTEKQKVLKQTAHEFAKGVIRPAALAADQMANAEEIIKKGSAWWEARKKVRQMGYHLAGFPKTLGGFEAGPLELQILLEEFGWASLGLGASIFLDSFAAAMTLTYQPLNKRLMDEIVMPFIKDLDGKITGCFAAAEPNHGSDVLLCFRGGSGEQEIALDTKAVFQGDEWIIDGQKAGWISNGPIATHAIVLVTICNSERVQGGGMAVVPLDSPGVTRSKPMEMLGSRDFPQCELFFSNVRIPKDYMIVGPDLFETAVDRLLNMAGIAVGTVATGLARAAFEEALEYSKKRVQGGRPIVNHQIIKAKLFDMFTKVEASRALSRATAKYCLAATGRTPVEYSAAAKIFCSQAAFDVASEAVQIHGAYGLTKECLVGKLFRDARSFLIADGCNEVLSLKRSDNLIENYNPLQ